MEVGTCIRVILIGFLCLFRLKLSSGQHITGNNPCLDASLHDCDKNAICISRNPGFFDCQCPQNFIDVSPDRTRFPGRACQLSENECFLGTHQCDPNAVCTDTAEAYACACREGYEDAGSEPGRQCTQKTQQDCRSATCAPEADCVETATGPMCQCKVGYLDVSHIKGQSFGHNCQLLRNECEDGTHDCSPNAQCIDSSEGFLCRCHDGYQDESPDFRRPGRVCVKTFVPPPPECNVNDPLSCNHGKLEVCTFINATYKCLCPPGIGRLPDGKCQVRNECRERRLNNCHFDSQCIDLADGYSCQCKPGYVDVSPDLVNEPGRICRRLVDECREPRRYAVDCDVHALCIDSEDAYVCRCLPGYADVSENYNRLPGRRCIVAVNECNDIDNNDCSQNAVCEDAKEGYTCKCRDGFIDLSPNTTHYPGRVCNKPKVPPASSSTASLKVIEPCDPNRPRCARGEVCALDKGLGRHVCLCAPEAMRFEDGVCRVVFACSESTQANDCDPNAICSNVFDSFECQCRPGYLDLSPDPLRRPGRVCQELRNECAHSSTNQCSPYAECVDTRDGYTCVCEDQYIDVSSESQLPPGRVCANASNECSHRSLHTCDDNADCVDKPLGYACQCAPGFVDVSAPILPPGRVCTVQTSCPTQKTDLMFLIDGSGSIGSFVFRNEVLRFVREFVELFHVGPDKTRVGVIQFSDQIRHEFDLGQFDSKIGVLQGVSDITYLTGLTRTGAAIRHMDQEGFSLRRGARPQSKEVSRIAIVITDGRSQDNVTAPAAEARRSGVTIFAIGVTDHILDSELLQISGSPNRFFHVHDFTDLDMRLRSLIQKQACPVEKKQPSNRTTCDPTTHDGCDRALNEICAEYQGRFECRCPGHFQRDPTNGVCGGGVCNPNLPTSCPWPEVCRRTPHTNYRCACPGGYWRHPQTGFCVTTPIESFNDTICTVGDARSCPMDEVCVREESGARKCVCSAGLERNRKSGKCVVPDSCDPTDVEACDARKRERCLPHFTGSYHTCQCPQNFRRHSVTGVCLLNECTAQQHDCDRFAKCVDTDSGYICICGPGFIDISADPERQPGRACLQEVNECDRGLHNCSEHATCLDTKQGFLCQCKPGYVDLSPNFRQFAGTTCKQLIDECSNPAWNNCHEEATCIDTTESYACICNPGYLNFDLRNPGRFCIKENKNDRCVAGNNDCDKNADCFARGDDDFECVCRSNYKDKSPNILSRPGRKCIPVIPECDNPRLNDCDAPRAICIDTDESFICRCGPNYLDISEDPVNRPGRLCKELLNECQLGLHDCARVGGICEDTPDSYSCRCGPNFLDVSPDPFNRPGRACKKLTNECEERTHDCSTNADCIDTEDFYLCACIGGYVDVSADPVNRPGRLCLPLIDECAENRHDCSPNARCIDTRESFRCQCRSEFFDESPQPLERPGRVCKPKIVNECRLGTHDCSQHALCLDRTDGFTCRCKDGFLDDSPNRIVRPGRICTLKPTEKPPECQIHIVNSCDLSLNEVCRLVGGSPKCGCPENYRRNAQTNACTMIDECLFPQLHDCSQNAACFDQVNGYTCQCKEGFRDKSVDPVNRPGRTCQPMINECKFDYLNDCHQNALCSDLEEGYDCRCKQGFRDISPDPFKPGRICQREVNECETPSLNTCDPNADCADALQGYQCSCREGFLDISPTLGAPGRACKRIVNECLNPSDNDCDPQATCTDTVDSYRCECPFSSKDISPNPAFPGRVCLPVVDECAEGIHDCDRQFAVCRDTEDSFTCECPRSFVDRSPQPLVKPGRVCVKLVDECRERQHTCHQNAECRDLEEGYTCECLKGFVDNSPDLSQPGRVCGVPPACPPNNDCSAAAVCEPLGGGDFTCTCIQGFVDHSTGGLRGRVCVRDNECRDPRLNDCSRNAICYDLPVGYRCECAQPYVDRSPDTNKPGRICEPPPPIEPPKRHPCQHPTLNDCSLLGSCRSTGPTTYTCECPGNYADLSPDPANKPGRVCIQQARVCLDPSRNDCHAFAICEELPGSTSKYTCRCRDGYQDVSPNPNLPGRVCKEAPNECLDASLNDCDPFAVCRDTPDSYTCHCPPLYQDISPNPRSRPGRLCRQLINECQNPQLNNCSRFANCFDRDVGYDCRCKTGYHDNTPSTPGRNCIPIINECDAGNLNDCDKRHADCVDLQGGYTCKCREPYRDESPDPVGAPGRICRFNECSDTRFHQCHVNAVCQDTDESYVCHCREGYIDISDNVLLPGRRCRKLDTTTLATRPTPPAGGIICGRTYCFPALNEVCVGGIRCQCRPGQSRRRPGESCVGVEQFKLSLRVMRRNEIPIFWNSVYGNPSSPRYVEIVDMFDKGIEHSAARTHLSPYVVRADTNFLEAPRVYNSTWRQGLIFNFTVDTIPGVTNERDLYNELMAAIKEMGYSVGGTELYIDRWYDPYRPVVPEGPLCGGRVCNVTLGEVCFADTVCGCPRGQQRAGPQSRCTEVEAFILPLWVIRNGLTENLQYNASFADPLGALYLSFVERFRQGIAQAYASTNLASAYINCEVNDIMDPVSINGSWSAGILYNFTVYCVRGRISTASSVWETLVLSCVSNNYQIGQCGLYISPYQANPYSPCFRSDCHPSAQCIRRGPNSYSCECPSDYFDLNPSYPGRRCRRKWDYNECERAQDNECRENSRCVDDSWLYHCECLPGFVDNSPEGALQMSSCVIDFCSDVDFCPRNSTCVNLREKPYCQCEREYVDIRQSPRRAAFGLTNHWCLLRGDVNECDLGLTNCSAVASCTDLPLGYDCACPPGFTDGNPSLPGRICGARLCDMCNKHGDCVHDPETNNITCRCYEDWHGAQCELVAAGGADMRLILVIIFAVLFLLLTLCCLLYFCLKCRCVKGRGLWYREPLFTYRKGVWPWSTLEASTSSESGAEFSAMSTGFGKGGGGSDYYPELAIPRAKLAAGKEKRQQQVDVNRLHGYLDDGVRIPRAKLSRSSSVERSESEIFSNVNQRAPAGAVQAAARRRYPSESASSTTSSDYTMREEFERRVITDVKTTKTVTAADVHGNNATAQFKVYPPAQQAGTEADRKASKSRALWPARFGGVKKEVTKKWHKVASDAANHASRSSEEQERDQKEIYESPGVLPSSGVSERDRGQSVTEVSVAGLRARDSDWGLETATTASQPRAMSDYSEQESISEGSISTRTSEPEDMYDKKVLVKKSRDWLPTRSGRGGAERYATEVSTKTVSKDTKKY